MSNFNFNFKSHDKFSALPSSLHRKEYILKREKKKSRMQRTPECLYFPKLYIPLVNVGCWFTITMKYNCKKLSCFSLLFSFQCMHLHLVVLRWIFLKRLYFFQINCSWTCNPFYFGKYCAGWNALVIYVITVI